MSTEAVRRFPELPAVLLSVPCAQITPPFGLRVLGITPAVTHIENPLIYCVDADMRLQ
jgi:hypothetical protein